MQPTIAVPTKAGVLVVPRRDAAHMLGVSERTLFDLTKSGVVPSVRIGTRGVRYSIKALEQFVESQLTGAK